MFAIFGLVITVLVFGLVIALMLGAVRHAETGEFSFTPEEYTACVFVAAIPFINTLMVLCLTVQLVVAYWPNVQVWFKNTIAQ